MTKEQLFAKWIFQPSCKDDIDAVIATEIEKAKPEKTNKIEITPHTLVEVNRAFRALKQDRNSYIHKVFSDDGVFDAMEEIRKMFDNYFVEQPQEQPALNPIADAYERGEKVKRKKWEKHEWFQKHTDTHIIDNNGNIFAKPMWDINSMKDKPHEWELYTEPAEQPAKPFDRERFERVFCIFALRGDYLNFEQIKNSTEHALKQLDAYYASKEGGANG